MSPPNGVKYSGLKCSHDHKPTVNTIENSLSNFEGDTGTFKFGLVASLCLLSLTTFPSKDSLPSHKQRLVTKPNSAVALSSSKVVRLFSIVSLFRCFVWGTNSCLTSLAGLQLRGWQIEMQEKPLPLNSTVDLLPWEHFNQEYLTPFGGFVIIQCSVLVFYYDR